MNQQKIGAFLKLLRNEEGLTQEQLAERLNVSRRTVSRWETGNNLPDLSILVELSDFYGVDLRELLDGERKSEKMNKELEETVHKVADYSNAQEQKVKKRMHTLFVLGLLASIVYLTMIFFEVADKSPVQEAVAGFSLGISFAIIIIGVIMTSRFSTKIRAYKMRILKRKSHQS